MQQAVSTLPGHNGDGPAPHVSITEREGAGISLQQCKNNIYDQKACFFSGGCESAEGLL